MEAMSDTTRGLDPQLLLDQATWVRGLATRLLKDEHAAEDVVQETWLAALQRRPVRETPTETDDGNRLRAWLAVVARNLALKRRRTDLARRDRERSVAIGESDQSHSEVERLRQHRSLAEAVLGLDDPYRSTLVLRYFDELSIQAIARKRGVSQDVVRQHLSRGVRMLKARLDRDHGGDREAWVRAIVGLAGERGGGAFSWTSVLAGSGLMGIKWTVGAIGLAGAVMLSVSIWSGPDALQGAIAPLEGRGHLPEPFAHAAPQSPASRLDPPETETKFPARSVMVREVPAGAQLSGRVVDAGGQGLPGAWVRCTDATNTGMEGAAITHSDGAFELSLEQHLAESSSVTLEVGCDGFVTAETEVGVGAGLSITLLRLPMVTGQVFGSDGEPAEPPGRVRLAILGRDSGEELEFETKIEAGGRFGWPSLPLGMLVQVSAMVRGAPELELDLVRELEPQGVETLELRLTPGAAVVGTVVDDSTGLPVEGASVWADGMDADAEGLRPSAVSDSLGRFELCGVKPSRRSTDAGRVYIVVWILARAPGYTSTPTRAFAVAGDAPQPYDFELRMAPSPCSIEGIVRGGAGLDRVPGAHVHAIDSQGRYVFTQTDDDGRFEFAELPAGKLALAIRHGELSDPGGCNNVHLEVSLEAGYRESVVLTLEGPGETGLAGRVHSTGDSVSGLRVTARHQFSANGMAIELDSKSVHTGPLGYYTIEGLSPGRYSVELDPPTSSGLSWGPGARRLELARGHRVDSVDFRVGASVVFGGRVVDGGGECSRYHVEIHHARSSMQADADSLAGTYVGENGTFLLPPLLEELYELRLMMGDRVLARRSVGPVTSRDIFISLDAAGKEE